MVCLHLLVAEPGSTLYPTTYLHSSPTFLLLWGLQQGDAAHEAAQGQVCLSAVPAPPSAGAGLGQVTALLWTVVSSRVASCIPHGEKVEIVTSMLSA